MQKIFNPNRGKDRIDLSNMDKILDDILNYMKSVIKIEDQNHIQFMAPVDIFYECYKSRDPNLNNYTEPQLFLEQFLRDGYVVESDVGNVYQINLEGIRFINKGGYRALTRRKCWNTIYSFLKTVVIFLNGLILLLFAYATWKKEDVTSDRGSRKEIYKNIDSDPGSVLIVNKELITYLALG